MGTIIRSEDAVRGDVWLYQYDANTRGEYEYPLGVHICDEDGDGMYDYCEYNVWISRRVGNLLTEDFDAVSAALAAVCVDEVVPHHSYWLDEMREWLKEQQEVVNEKA